MGTRLEGKKALITGGTRGIGKAIARLFIEEGAHVRITGTNPVNGEKALEELKQLAKVEQRVSLSCFNVGKKDEVEGTLNKILDEEGAFDVIVNNAGITRDQLLMKLTPEDWDAVIQTNLTSIYLICHTCIRPMMKARSGKIINISSVVGLLGNPGQTNYCASKAGVLGFTKALAKEVGGKGIQVNAIAPGFIETDMTDALSDAIKEKLMTLIPLKKLGKPEDVAEAALFLAADSGNYLTGQTLSIDGGMSM
jgi:3-oxoacyl-[acyl-carrier protein] reductase